MTFIVFFFFFNDTATTEIYTLSLHDALPILHRMNLKRLEGEAIRDAILSVSGRLDQRMYGSSVPLHPSQFLEADRKSTRLNSSHTVISYAVFCLKKKKKKKKKETYFKRQESQ